MTSQPIESDLVLGISPDNHMLHVGPAHQVVAHVLQIPVGEKPVPQSALEFYDIAGSRRSIHELSEMAGVEADPALLDAYDQAVLDSEPDADSPSAADLGPDVDLEPEPGAEPGPIPDRDARRRQRRLLRRIYAALDFGQAYLTEHPEAGNQGPNVPPVTEVPRPVGSYPEVLDGLARDFSPWEPSNRGNWFHNLWHAATGN